MSDDSHRLSERRVRVHTSVGLFEGTLTCSPVVRTLDAINQLSSGFLTLHPPLRSPLGPPFGGGPLALAKSSLLFLLELDQDARPHPGKAGLPRFWKAPVALRVHDHLVLGNVHVPMGGNPLMRIHQEGPTFLALTGVEVSGGVAAFEAPFLAVNRAHVTAAQEVQDGFVPGLDALSLERVEAP
jgi:hypothetical protein